MPTVQLSRVATPRQFEFKQDNSEKPKQLRKDALHLRPGTTTEVTDDELAFIKENDKPLFRLLTVIGASKAEKAKLPTEAKLSDAAAEASARDAAKKAADAEAEASAKDRKAAKAADKPTPGTPTADAEAPEAEAKGSKKKDSPSA